MRPFWTLIPQEEIALNDFEAQVKDHAEKYHSLADVDPDEADEHLLQIAYLCVERMEWREARTRRADEEADGRARAEQETAIPPYEVIR